MLTQISFLRKTSLEIRFATKSTFKLIFVIICISFQVCFCEEQLDDKKVHQQFFCPHGAACLIYNLITNALRDSRLQDHELHASLLPARIHNEEEVMARWSASDTKLHESNLISQRERMSIEFSEEKSVCQGSLCKMSSEEPYRNDGAMEVYVALKFKWI